MKKRLKCRLAAMLCLGLLVNATPGSVFAEGAIQEIDMGTFKNSVKGEQGDTPSGNVTDGDRDISKAKVHYSHKGSFDGGEITIICIHEALSGREIPPECYTVEYPDKAGPVLAVIKGINGYYGEQAITGEFIEQAPASSNVITAKRTVVPTSTRWTIMPGFNVSRVRTTDGKTVAVSRVRDRSRSTKKEPWYYAGIKAKRAGIECIILDGTGGERASYYIYSEAPKVISKALKVNDACTLSVNDYISGTTFLKPVSVTSKKPTVAEVNGENAINVLADGSSKITVQYPGRKLGGTLTAKLPAFTKLNVTLRNRPVKLKLKNLPRDAAVSYRSSDPLTVKVNPDGYAAPVANGTAVVTANTGNVTAECTVTVKGLK